MVMCCSFPVPRSLADTFTIPFASISKVTSICGTPRRCRRDSVQSELAEGLVVSCELSLTLYYVDVNSCLVICRCGEDLALLCRNRCISLDQPCSNAAHCLDGQGQRSNIQKKDIACACISCKLSALDGSTKCNALIRVQGFAWLFACELLYLVLYSRDTCGTAYQQYLTQLGSCDTCIGKSALYRLCCSSPPGRVSARRILLL